MYKRILTGFEYMSECYLFLQIWNLMYMIVYLLNQNNLKIDVLCRNLKKKKRFFFLLVLGENVWMEELGGVSVLIHIFLRKRGYYSIHYVTTLHWRKTGNRTWENAVSVANFTINMTFLKQSSIRFNFRLVVVLNHWILYI